MIVETVVNSIFEGLMPSGLYGGNNQYLLGLGIDPDVPLTDNVKDIKIGGGIRPVLYEQFSGAEVDSYPIAIINTPQSDITWVVLANGKIIAYEDSLVSAGLIGQVAGNRASGAFYYNNYIYITGTGALHDDVSRLGPLNTLPFDGETSNFVVGEVVTSSGGARGTVVGVTDAGTTGTLLLNQVSGIFLDNNTITSASGAAVVNRTFASLITDNVWKGATLGTQTALGDATYPNTLLNIPYLNHYGFTHSDGVAYFLDYKNGKGYIHKIQTTKTTNQGDANNGSAYGSVGDLSLPFDYVPITACSMGNDIVIAATPTVDREVNQGNAMLFFWDAAEELFFHKVPLDDPLCTTLWYEGGVLHGLSGDINGSYRLFKYVGGDAVTTVKLIEDGSLPLQGASSFVGRRLVWAADTVLPQISSGLYAYGSKSELFPQGLHHIALSEFV